MRKAHPTFRLRCGARDYDLNEPTGLRPVSFNPLAATPIDLPAMPDLYSTDYEFFIGNRVDNSILPLAYPIFVVSR